MGGTSAGQRPYLSWLAHASVGLLLAAVLTVAFSYHSVHCSFPYQLHGTEGGMLQSVRGMLEGKSPWTLDNAFEYANCYGVGLPWVVAKLRPLAPSMNLLVLMRLVVAGAAFMGLGLIFLQARDGGARWMEALAAATVVYTGLLYYDSLAAHPDGLAFMLYLLSIVAATREGRGNAMAAGCFAVLAFYTKPYGLLAAPVGAVIMFSLGRWRDILWSALGALLSLGAIYALLQPWAPEYFFITVTLNANSTDYDAGHLWHQNVQMAKNHWPILAACAAGGLLAFKRRRLPELTTMDRAWIVAAGVVYVILLGPGGHKGAFLRYYQQLFIPIAVLAAAAWMRATGWSPGWRSAIFTLDAAVMLLFNVQSYPTSSLSHRPEMKRIEAWVASHPYSLYPAPFASIAVEKGALVYHNDHNDCFLLHGKDGPLYRMAVEREAAMQRDLSAGRFESVVLPFDDPALTAGPHPHYRKATPLCFFSPIGWKCYTVYERVGFVPRAHD